jgi:hypothetical protein
MQLVAGLAIGLAYARVDGSDRWADFLLACFGGCFVVGLVQKSWRMWSLRRDNENVSLVDAAWPLAVAAFMVFCGAAAAATRYKWWAFLDSSGDTSWVTEDFNDTALYLAVICGYFERHQTPARRGWRRWIALLVDACAWLLGAYWLTFVLVDGIMIVGLVHIAMRGVEIAQPTRLAGQPFYPANLHTELTQLFMVRAYLTGALLAAATAANVALARTWSRGWVQRLLWSALCLLSLLLAWRLVQWCLRVAFPTLSPYFYSALDSLPPGNLAVALSIVVTATAAFAIRVCAVPRPSESTSPTPTTVTQRCLHEWIFVPWLFLLGAAWKGVTSVSETYGMTNFLGWGPGSWWAVPYWVLQAAASQPRWMIWLAALILVAQRAWRWWRPKTVPASVQWTVPLAKFGLVWIFALLTGLLVIPAAPWLGLALYLRWGGP